ncbi:MAG: T9SS type A sorting domain-containing protein, partial [Bacteroidota bacterium]
YRIQQNTIQPIRVETKEGIVRIGENTLQEAAKVIVSDANVLPEAAFCLPIVAQQVGQPVGLQFALDWDENLLDLEEVKLNNALFDSDNISIYNAETAGRLRFVWTDIIELNSINLQDSITLLELCFQANGEIGTQTTVSFEESTPFEAIQLDNEGNIQPIAVELKNGVINFLTNNVDVLPGDTDVDGEVSHYDLINIGLGHGETGPARANASLAFTPQAAEDWANSTPITNINYKHADTDGNGLIDRDDLLAIEQNWTLAPTLFNTVVTEDGIPFYVDIDTVRLVENQQVPVILGAADQLAKDIYGLAFSIYYESEAMLENGFGVSTEQSWLGTSEELIQVQRFFPAEKRVDVAISRIDQNGRDGFGELLALDIVMEDVILFEPGDIEFRIDHVKAVGDVEQNITFNTKDDQDKQSLTNTNQQVVPKIKIYPNPATDVLYINSKDLDIQQIEVYDLFGRLLLQYTASEQIDVSAWKSGLYFIHIKTDQGNMSKKINIQ